MRCAAALMAAFTVASCQAAPYTWALADGEGEVGAILSTATGLPQIAIGCIEGRPALVMQLRAFTDLPNDGAHSVRLDAGSWSTTVEATVVGSAATARLNAEVPASQEVLDALQAGAVKASVGDRSWVGGGADPDGALPAFRDRCMRYIAAG
jgi:hypothetical protein